METKEAIELCDEIKGMLSAVVMTEQSYNETLNGVDDVIELLQRGEKFEKKFLEIFNENKKVWQMWDEFKENFGNGTMENDVGGRLGPINNIMDNYEQKYFPKEADNET